MNKNNDRLKKYNDFIKITPIYKETLISLLKEKKEEIDAKIEKSNADARIGPAEFKKRKEIFESALEQVVLGKDLLVDEIVNKFNLVGVPSLLAAEEEPEPALEHVVLGKDLLVDEIVNKFNLVGVPSLPADEEEPEPALEHVVLGKDLLVDEIVNKFNHVGVPSLPATKTNLISQKTIVPAISSFGNLSEIIKSEIFSKISKILILGKTQESPVSSGVKVTMDGKSPYKKECVTHEFNFSKILVGGGPTNMKPESKNVKNAFEILVIDIEVIEDVEKLKELSQMIEKLLKILTEPKKNREISNYDAESTELPSFKGGGHSFFNNYKTHRLPTLSDYISRDTSFY